MWIFIAVISVLWIGFFIWACTDSAKRRKERNGKNSGPAFRTEEDLDEYGKPMSDEHHSKIDFDDAE